MNKPDRLPPPVVEGLHDGVLQQPSASRELAVSVPPYPDMANGDRVYLVMDGDGDEGSYNNSFSIKDGFVGQTIHFAIPGATVLVNFNRAVTLHYRVENEHGEAVESESVKFQVGS
jgi:hypothetical protein